MLKKALLATLFAVVSTACATSPSAEPIRLDASSNQSAQTSFDKMLANATRVRQEELQFAILKINMDGVGSAAEMLANPDLRSPTVIRVKDRLAGMTAEEILAEADEVTSVQLVRPGR